MWLLITLLSMLLLTLADLLGKRIVSDAREYPILKLRISSISVDAIVLLFLYLFFYRGSGVHLWQLAFGHPLIILATLLNVFDTFLYLQGLKYIGLSIQRAYDGMSNILFFLGMLLIHLLSGRLGEVGKMLVPSRYILILLLLGASLILPRLCRTEESGEAGERINPGKRKLLLGLLFTFLGLLCDTVEMLSSVYIFSESDISSVDYMAAGFLTAVLCGVGFYVLLYRRTRESFLPFQKGSRVYLLYGLLSVSAIVLYLYGLSLAPVRSGILWVAYPILPILGSAVFLKEQYSIRQYICIGVIALSSIAFGLMDYIAP